MIEVNLLSGKRDKSSSVLGGLDLNLINIKMLIFALLFLYIPEGFIVDYFDNEIKTIQDTNNILRKDFSDLNKKVKALKEIEDQVTVLKEQEDKLNRKLEVVKQIINQRQNPFNVLYYLAQNTPEDLWLTELNLENNNLVVSGFSKNWKSIGKFLENLRNSIFFDKNINYEQPPGVNQTDNRVEGFKISAKVVRFE